MSDEKNKEIKTETKKKKSLVKKIILAVIFLIIGIVVICSLPLLYFIVEMLYSMFIDVPSKPKVKHGEFPFKLVYEYKGEIKEIDDKITCDYEGLSWSLDGGNTRDWNYEFGKDDEYGNYVIDIINERELYIDVPDACDYYMGDKEYTKEDAHPLIRFVEEETGTNYEETDKIDSVGIKIIDFRPSEPLKGNIK